MSYSCTSTFHGSSASKSPTFLAWGNCANRSDRYACGSTPFALAVSTIENRLALATHPSRYH